MKRLFVSLFCVLTLVPAIAHAQLSFSQQGLATGWDRPSGNPSPYDWIVGDWNNDGCVDLFQVSHGMTLGTAIMRMGDCAGGFGPDIYPNLHAVLSNNASQLGWAIGAFDMDADGNQDVWLGGWQQNRLCYGDGTGNSWTCYYINNGTGPKQVGDADGDGLLDWFDGSNWRINNGTRAAGSWPTVSNLFSLDGPAVLDVNADGWPDYFDLVADRMYLGTPGGTFTHQQLSLDVRGIAFRDVNGDGCLDLGVQSGTYWYRDNRSWWLQGAGCDGVFTSVPSTSLTWYPGMEFEMVDLDNDGVDEVVQTQSTEFYSCAGTSCGPFHIFEQDGTQLSHGISWVFAYYQMTAVIDYDDDGRIDIPAITGATQSGTARGISLFRNESVLANHWVKVRLPELHSPFAVPAKIEALDADTSAFIYAIDVYSGMHLPSWKYHLGVGPRATVKIRVTWPDATTAEVTTTVDQTVDVTTGPPPPPPPPPPPDTTPPTIAFSAASLAATVTDNVAPTSVVWALDGAPIGTAIEAPWTQAVDIMSLAPGAHTISATAFDAAGNQQTATMTWTVP